MQSKSKAEIWIECALVAMASFLLFQPLWAAARFTDFQARDLSRAQELLRGVWIFYGPETTGGGNLPGGFYYAILALPLALGLGWQGAFWLMILGISISAAMIWHFFRNRFSRTVALASAAFLFSSNMYLRALKSFQNPSFVPVFATLSIILLVQTFTADRRSKSKWLLACLLMALGIQLHFTMIALFLTAIILQIFSKQLRLYALPVKDFLLGVAVYCLTLSPHFIWALAKRAGVHFGAETAVAVGSGSNSIPLLFKYVIKGFQRYPAQRSLLKFAEMFLIPEWLIFFAIIGLSWLISRKKFKMPLSSSSAKIWSPELSIAAIATAISFLPAIGGIALDWNVRYTLVFTINLTFFFGFLFAQTREFLAKTDIWIFATAVVAAIAVSIGESYTELQEAFGLYPHVILFVVIAAFLIDLIRRKRYFSRNLFLFYASGTLLGYALLLHTGLVSLAISRVEHELTINESSLLSSAMNEATGWNYAQARHHLFYVGVDPGHSFAWMEAFRKPAENKTRKADGFIIAMGASAKNGDFVSWLEMQGIESSLLDFVRTGEVKLLEPQMHGRVLLQPYVFRDSFRSEDFLQNIGEPYAPSSFDDLKRPDLETFEFRFNEHPQKIRDFENFVRVQRIQQNPKQWLIQVSLHGLSLSQPTEWTVPDWVESLSQPGLEITCAEKTETLSLAHSIGFRYEGTQWLPNHVLLAPFLRTWTDPCNGAAITGISFMFESAEISGSGKRLFLPGQKFKVH